MSYFRELPNISAVSLLPGRQRSDERVLVKNIYKRAKLRTDIDYAVTAFDFRIIKEGDRPDTIAASIYDDPELDWVILITNNIINVRDQWPLSNNDLHEYMLDKYGSDAALTEPHHYETREIRDSKGRLILPGGLTVDQGFTIPDPNSPLQDLDPTVAVTNWLVETRKNNEKRAIQVLRPQYVNQLIDDANDILEYQESSQFTEDGGKIAFNDLI